MPFITQLIITNFSLLYKYLNSSNFKKKDFGRATNIRVSINSEKYSY